jgi:hypothetical protein
LERINIESRVLIAGRVMSKRKATVGRAVKANCVAPEGGAAYGRIAGKELSDLKVKTTTGAKF